MQKSTCSSSCGECVSAKATDIRLDKIGGTEKETLCNSSDSPAEKAACLVMEKVTPYIIGSTIAILCGATMAILFGSTTLAGLLAGIGGVGLIMGTLATDEAAFYQTPDVIDGVSLGCSGGTCLYHGSSYFASLLAGGLSLAGALAVAGGGDFNDFGPPGYY